LGASGDFIKAYGHLGAAATFVAYENAFSEGKTRGGFKSRVNAGTRASVLRHLKGGGVSDGSLLP